MSADTWDAILTKTISQINSNLTDDGIWFCLFVCWTWVLMSIKWEFDFNYKVLESQSIVSGIITMQNALLYSSAFINVSGNTSVPKTDD